MASKEEWWELNLGIVSWGQEVESISGAPTVCFMLEVEAIAWRRNNAKPDV